MVAVDDGQVHFAILVGSGLVAEYRLFVYPFVAGEGQRLFADATAVGELRLVEFSCSGPAWSSSATERRNVLAELRVGS